MKHKMHPNEKQTHRFLGAEGVFRHEGVHHVITLVRLSVQLFHEEREELVRHVLRDAVSFDGKGERGQKNKTA